MVRKVEEEFVSGSEAVREDRLETGYSLLANEVADWWRSARVLQQAILAIIRGTSEEEQDG